MNRERTLAAFENLLGRSFWLPAKERGFEHELSISVYRPSHAPDVLLYFWEVDRHHQRIALPGSLRK